MSDAARRAALECLLAVERDDAYANLVMPAILASRHLAGRDAGFATELAYGSLRMRGLYDAVIGAASQRDARSLDTTVRAVLWLGAHQALSMGTPAHAAVSETVALAKSAGAGRASGLVNAVMRRITERDRGAWLSIVAPGSSRRALATRHSHPEWVVGELEKSLGLRGMSRDLAALLDAHNQPAKVTLVARPGLVERDELAAACGGTPTPFSPYGVTLAGGSVSGIPAVDRGAAGVQDEGSQIVAAALASASAKDVAANERWLDACAGPGGKTALLGALAAQRGATVAALELHEHRAGLVRGNVRALPDGVVEVSQGDATTWSSGTFDRILVDAPCTGVGALRRRPEARWRRTPGDLAQLTDLQRRLLGHAAELVTEGGVIAYVTCSPVLAETRDIVEASGLRMLDARAAVADVTGTDPERWGAGPDVQLWTHRDGTDSMYLALLAAP